MTTEERIEQVLKDSDMELRKISGALPNVGNRPHYPMFLLWNAVCAGREFREDGETASRLRRIWPQAFRVLSNFSYQIVDDHVRILTLPEQREADLDTIVHSLSRQQCAHEIFADMGQWRIYHVVDTSQFQSVEEFRTHYEAITVFQDILRDPAHSMLIVLLDDSRACRDTAEEIREFLARQESLYDSVVLISNLTRSNQSYPVEELYRIAIGVIMLSNNDPVFDTDPAAFQRRSSLFSGGGFFTVSYQCLERPNRDIALQIQQVILDEAENLFSSLAAPEGQPWTWNGFLASDPARTGRNPQCEEAVRNWAVNIDSQIFERLPLRQNPRRIRTSLSALPYNRLKEYTFPGILDHVAARYSRDELLADGAQEKAGRRAEDLAEKWKASARKTRPLPAFRNLTDEEIALMGGELDSGTPREGADAKQYLAECVRVEVRRQILYPRLQQALEELRVEARQKEEALIGLQNAYRQLIPPRGFGDLGGSYAQIARDFLRGGEGEAFLRQICCEGAGIPDMLDQIRACFKKLILRNRKHFSLSFADEWMKRLRFDDGNRGDGNIYRTISRILTSEEDGRFYLRGNYPVSNKRLRVFFLQTTIRDAEHPTGTELYENLRTAFQSDPNLQYLNTGYSGALEAYTILSLDKMNLRL